ncbi:MarC family protein [Blastopirellula marina]|uniref:UPF0056 membrane protein n=1 Tax=Blastopirellula marina DSM 3645 TaxID=314230 RepID=A3ZTD8_9BACT|nr:MarC family protein [Blastopirellula marina]EAQ80194.1 hypothetical protein DSM3645_19398 [Blastopirellula marina DSM 3645]
MNFELLFGEFLLLIATIDPIGTLSIFVGVTGKSPKEDRPRIALKATLIGGAVLLAFLVLGQFILGALDIRLESFQLAGGLILFLLGLQMVFGVGPAVEAPKAEAGHDVAVFPLALPSIASPGSILAVVILTDNHRFTMLEQAVTAVVLVVVLGLTYVLMLAANPIHRLIGDTGGMIIVKVMGLLLCALATENCVEAVQQLWS